MLYIGVVIEIEGEEAEKSLSALPFLSIYSKKGNQLLGVIELETLDKWKEIEESLQSISGFLSFSILSSYTEPNKE